MKTSTLFAAVALTLAASGAAVAQEATYEYPQATASMTSKAAQTTRAAVVAALKQARADGSVQTGEADVRQSMPFISTTTRARVHAQAIAARASGELRNAHGEYTAHPVVLSAAELRLAGK